MTDRPTRRQFLGAGMALGASALLVPPARLLASCERTPGTLPGDPESFAWRGPFWRQGAPFLQSLRGARSDGAVLVVAGQVRDTSDCDPLAGAVLDIWHCGPDAKYYNDVTEPLFRGRVRCDDEGRYEYETLVPANYRAEGSYRPAHIHVIVRTEGYEPFTTQMYFDGDPYLETDPLELVREPLVCKLSQHQPGDTVRGRTANGAFATTEFDLNVPRRKPG